MRPLSSHESRDYLRVTALTCGSWSGPEVGTVPGTGVRLRAGRVLTWGPGGRPGAGDRRRSGDRQWFSATGFGAVGHSGRPRSVCILCVLALLDGVLACSAATRQKDSDRWRRRQISPTVRKKFGITVIKLGYNAFENKMCQL